MSDAAKFLASYAKKFNAGAFATPLAKELANDPASVREWGAGPRRAVAVVKHLTRTSTRRDFTGDVFYLPQGSWVVTHFAREDRAPIPEQLKDFDFIMAYPEDLALAAVLGAWGFKPVAVRVTAAAEIIACYGRFVDARRYAPIDLVTVAQLRQPPLTLDDRGWLLGELGGIDGWYDDYPYYSDGSWSAVSLRGFRRDDPAWGVKPSEMPRKWQEAHPDAAGFKCEWTVLADRCHALVALAKTIAGDSEMERVRLLRMEGRGGKGSRLRRHTDITDRNAGTRDGQIMRLHFPLVTHREITMEAWELDGERLTNHLPAWSLWYLDQRKPHAVTNPTAVDRVHLVVDVVADDRTRRRVLEAACPTPST